MSGSESESPTIFARNGKIDFGGGAPTSPVANGIIYSERPKFLASKSLPSAYAIQDTKTNLLMTMVKGSEEKGAYAGMEEVFSPGNVKQGGLSKGHIETTAPIESVKAAVSKFGGIVAWKAHRNRTQSMERIIPVREELEEVQEEILHQKEQSEAVAELESQVSKELERTKQRIEELKLALENAQTEEQQAKHDSELAKLRLEEMEQVIAKENDVITEAQLEGTTAEHTAAVSELKSIKEELESLHLKFASLVSEKDSAVKNADDVAAATTDSEKALEELTIELVAVKESLESAQASLIEAEEKRIGAAVARERDCLNWKKELDDAEEELCRLNLQILSFEDLKSKVNTASTLLLDLKAEMAAYTETILKKEMSDKQLVEGDAVEANDRTCMSIQLSVDSAKGELEDVTLNIEKAIAEVKCLKMAATSLKSELEGEKSTIAITKQREGISSVVAASLEAELENNMAEIFVVQGNINESQENSEELTNQLEQAAQEADQAKSLARIAREELHKATIEAGKAKAERHTMESRLIAAHKEIEASNSSEVLALEAIKALQDKQKSPTGVTLSQEEYNELSKCAYQAEEQANIRVAEAISRIEVAKELEAKSLETLEEVNRELATRQEELKAATEKANEANEGKLAVEQELRMLRADLEQRRKDSDSAQEVSIPTTSSRTSTETFESEYSDYDAVPSPQEPSTEEKMQKSSIQADSVSDSKEVKKKKKSFFPKMLTLLGKSKSKKKPT